MINTWYWIVFGQNDPGFTFKDHETMGKVKRQYLKYRRLTEAKANGEINDKQFSKEAEAIEKKINNLISYNPAWKVEYTRALAYTVKLFYNNNMIEW
jgi:hypothetical protein